MGLRDKLVQTSAFEAAGPRAVVAGSPAIPKQEPEPRRAWGSGHGVVRATRSWHRRMGTRPRPSSSNVHAVPLRRRRGAIDGALHVRLLPRAQLHARFNLCSK